MTTMTNQIEQNKNHKSILPKFIFLIVYTIVLIILYYILFTSGINPLIAFLLLLFFFIIVIGPLFGGLRKSLYSRMFSDEKKKTRGGYGYQRLKEIIKKESQIKSYKPRKRRHINLNIKYRKPLVVKCSNCGMTVAGFVKKCPRCGEAIL